MREKWMQMAIDLAVENVAKCLGGPFGAVIVKDDQVVATGVNLVTSTNDPSAHAEVVAIRRACQTLQTYQLTDCELYTSCEPCPMCLGTVYWARLKSYYYACNRCNAADAGFDDDFIYREIGLPAEQRSVPGHQLLGEAGVRAFQGWIAASNKICY